MKARGRHSIDALHVVVPARDEAALLGDCLRALAAAMDLLATSRPDVVATTTIALDSCRDASHDIVARVAASDERIRALAVRHGSVGPTRRAGVQHALDLAEERPVRQRLEATWIACTDADSTVPEDWLVGQVTAAETGVDLLLGTVELRGSAEDNPLFALWSARYSGAADHDHVHGANLGVRASAYAAAGGFPPLSVHEDVALVSSVRAQGGLVQSTDTIPVVTSGRRDGRTPAGFSGYLRALGQPTTTRKDLTR